MGLMQRGLMLAVMTLWLLVLTACASGERDIRYMSSEQRPALQIPAGLDTPNYNPRMAVPAVPGKGVQPSDSGVDIELPPKLEDTE